MAHCTAGTHLLMVTWNSIAARARHYIIRQYQKNPSQESTVRLAQRTTPNDNKTQGCGAGNHSQNLKLHQVPEGLRDAARDLVLLERPVQKRNIAQGSLSWVLPCALALAHKTDLQGHDNHTGTLKNGSRRLLQNVTRQLIEISGSAPT